MTKASGLESHPPMQGAMAVKLRRDVLRVSSKALEERACFGLVPLKTKQEPQLITLWGSTAT